MQTFRLKLNDIYVVKKAPLEKWKFFGYSKMKGVDLSVKDSLKYKKYLIKPSSHFGSKSKRLYEAKSWQ